MLRLPARFRRDLTKAERQVLEAARTGKIADLAIGATVDIKNASGWHDRTIRAEFLSFMLSDMGQVRGKSLQLRGALIAGKFDIPLRQLDIGVIFSYCRFVGHVSLADTSIKGLAITHCLFAELVDASRMKIEGHTSFEGSIFRRSLQLRGADLKADFVCSGAHLERSTLDTALDATGMTVQGDVILGARNEHGEVIRDGAGNPLPFTADGKVDLSQADIGGQLACGGGRFTNSGETALSLYLAKIRGGVFLNRAVDGQGLPIRTKSGEQLTFSAEGAVDLAATEIDTGLWCEGTINNPDGYAIDCSGAKITGDVSLSDGFHATGTVSLGNTAIDRDLFCRNGIFEHSAGVALDCSGAKIGRDGYFTGKFAATGTVLLSTADFGGILNCRQGSFTSTTESRPALIAERTIVKSAVLLEEMNATGEVRLAGMEIGGPLNCNGATFNNQNGDALDCSGAKIGGKVSIGSGFQATGTVRLSTADLGGVLDCEGAKFTAPPQTKIALIAERTIVKSAVLLRGIAAEGQVRLTGMEIRGPLNCKDATLTNPNGDALDCSGAKIGQDGNFTGKFTATGAVLLSTADFGGILNCRQGSFTSTTESRPALVAERTIVKSAVLLEEMNATGEVRLIGMEIGGPLNCHGATFNNQNGDALDCSGAKIGGDVSIGAGFQATGTVRLSTADLGGVLDCEGAKFTAPPQTKIALIAERTIVKSAVLLRRISAEGEVQLADMEIGGLFSCTNSTFKNSSGNALSCTGAKIGGDVSLSDGFHATGTVSLENTAIDRDLFCRNGIFEHSAGVALDCSGAKIGRDGYFTGKFAATGTVLLSTADFGGILNCRQGSFTSTTESRPALVAERTIVKSAVLLEEMNATGEVRLAGMEIGGPLNCHGATFNNQNGDALDCSGAKIGGDTSLDKSPDAGFSATGTVRFQGSNIGGALSCSGQA